jgi:hypothetical protein
MVVPEVPNAIAIPVAILETRIVHTTIALPVTISISALLLLHLSRRVMAALSVPLSLRALLAGHASLPRALPLPLALPTCWALDVLIPDLRVWDLLALDHSLATPALPVELPAGTLALDRLRTLRRLRRCLLLRGCWRGVPATLAAPIAAPIAAPVAAATICVAIAITAPAILLRQSGSRCYGGKQCGYNDLLTHILRSKWMREQDRRFILVPY